MPESLNLKYFVTVDANGTVPLRGRTSGNGLPIQVDTTKFLIPTPETLMATDGAFMNVQ